MRIIGIDEISSVSDMENTVQEWPSLNRKHFILELRNLWLLGQMHRKQSSLKGKAVPVTGRGGP
jgi:hypothetical protein